MFEFLTFCPPKQTVLRVSVARSASRVRKPCPGWISAIADIDHAVSKLSGRLPWRPLLCEDEHVAELQAARDGLMKQVLRNEQLKLRLAKLLRERFRASSEKLRGALEQLELILGDLEEQVAETASPETDEPAAPTQRRKPARKPLPESLPHDVVEHAAPCACPKCGGSLHPLGEDVTEVLDYVPGSFRVTRHVRPKLSCRSCV